MLNKRGAEKIFSIWWFFVVVVVAVAVIVGVNVYFWAEVDVREVEADVLADKVLDCLIEQDELRDDFLEAEFDLLEDCGFSEGIVGSGGIYYLEVSVLDETGGVRGESVEYGVSSYKEDCEIQLGDKEKGIKGVTGKNLVQCVRKEGFVENGKIVVLAGSNQIGRRVPYAE
tara:strand:+ start:415 stop:927 length:513 start_codon:yes stop_codon:yes gene_type:complete